MNLDMARSEVFNTDCIEYMRSLPSKYFDLAVCDPPFGKGNDDTLETGGGDSTREDASKDTTSWNRLKGGRREKYYSPQKTGGGRKVRRKIQKVFQAGTGFKEERGRQDTVFQWGGY